MPIPTMRFILLGDGTNTCVSAEESTELLLWLKIKGVVPGGTQPWQLCLRTQKNRELQGSWTRNWCYWAS